MANSGIFRTSIFGGFNKNDVLKYFEDIKRDCADETEQLKVTNSELLEKLTQLENDCHKAKAENEQLKQAAQQLLSVADENAMLKAKVEELSQRANQAESYKSRCEQLMRAVVRTESENTSLKNQVTKLQEVADRVEKLDFDALQREISLCADEKSKLALSLNKISDTLGSLSIAINTAKDKDEGLSKSLSSLVNMVAAMKNAVADVDHPEE